MNVPVAELSWKVNSLCVFIHSQIEVSADPFQFHVVPVLVIEQTSQRNKKFTTRS